MYSFVCNLSLVAFLIFYSNIAYSTVDGLQNSDPVSNLASVNQIKSEDFTQQINDTITKNDIKLELSYEANNFYFSVFHYDDWLWIISNKQAKLVKIEAQSEFQDFSNSEHKIFRVKTKLFPKISLSDDNIIKIILDKVEEMNKSSKVPNIINDNKNNIVKLSNIGHENIVKLKNPDNGEDMIVILSAINGYNVDMDYKFVYFRMNKTYVGTFILPNTSKLQTRVVDDNNVELLLLDNVKIKKDFLYNVENSFYELPKMTDVFFNFKLWRKERSFSVEERELHNDVIHGNRKEKILALTKIAKLYLAYGMAQEALNHLDYVAILDTNITDDFYYNSIYTVALYLIGQYKEASKIFKKIDLSKLFLQQKEEFKFWNNAIDIMNGDHSKDLNYLLYKDTFLQNYINNEHFALISLQLYIENDQLDMAHRLYRLMKMFPNVDVGSLELLHAKLLYKLNNKDIAPIISIYDNILHDPKENMRTKMIVALDRAELLLNLEDVNNKEIIESLEKIRTIWRGDEIEAHYLYVLANFYLRDLQFYNSLQTFAELKKYFSNTMYSVNISDQMFKVFSRLFSDENTNLEDNIKSLTAFYEFNEYMPVSSDGIKIYMNIIDKMLMLGLYDDAIEMLSHFIDKRLEGNDKLHAKLKLVQIYVESKKYDAAWDVLSKFDCNNEMDCYSDFLHMCINVGLNLAKYDLVDEYISLLPKEEIFDAKLELSWHKHDWQQVIVLLQGKLEYRLDPQALLTEEEKYHLTLLAITYASLYDDKNVHNLIKAYELLLSSDSYEFRLLRALNRFGGSKESNASKAFVFPIKGSAKETKEMIDQLF